jgi:hypothetical protein
MKAVERMHLGKVAAIGCIACLKAGNEGTPAEIHHIRHGMGMGQRNNHFRTIPLCHAHHRGTLGLKVPSIHGSRDAFIKTFGTELELLQMVDRLIGGKAA